MINAWLDHDYDDQSFFWKELENTRDKVLESLSAKERYALFQDFDMFKYFYIEEKADEYLSHYNE